MNLGDVERELRQGPPVEDDYRTRALILDDATPIAAYSVGTRLVRARTVNRVRVASTGLAIAAGLALAFALGRLSVAPAVQPAASAPTGVRVQPAFVADAIRQAFYSGAPRSTTWLVCTADSVLACSDVPAIRTSDVFGTDEWPLLRPAAVKSGDVIVGAQLDPVVPVSAYLLAADDPSGGGPQLLPVSTHPGDTFFDLGVLKPGRYVVSVLTDPTAPTLSGQTVIGISVEA